MNKKQIMTKAKQVLMNNGWIQGQIDLDKELHPEKEFNKEKMVDEILFQWDDGTIVLSSEGDLNINGYPEYMYSLEESLDKEFSKAGLFVEAYDGGTFHVTEDN